jgi:hypothetical protein
MCIREKTPEKYPAAAVLLRGTVKTTTIRSSSGAPSTAWSLVVR